MDAKQRRKARREKELLDLGREAKVVRIAALDTEQVAQEMNRQRSDLLIKLSQVEIDRARWKEEAVRRAGENADLEQVLANVRAELAGVRLGLEAAEGREAELDRRVQRLKDDGRDADKLRRRLREREAELETERKKCAALSHLLRQHEAQAQAVVDAEKAARAAFERPEGR